MNTMSKRSERSTERLNVSRTVEKNLNGKASNEQFVREQLDPATGSIQPTDKMLRVVYYTLVGVAIEEVAHLCGLTAKQCRYALHKAGLGNKKQIQQARAELINDWTMLHTVLNKVSDRAWEDMPSKLKLFMLPN